MYKIFIFKINIRRYYRNLRNVAKVTLTFSRDKSDCFVRFRRKKCKFCNKDIAIPDNRMCINNNKIVNKSVPLSKLVAPTIIGNYENRHLKRNTGA